MDLVCTRLQIETSMPRVELAFADDVSTGPPCLPLDALTFPILDASRSSCGGLAHLPNCSLSLLGLTGPMPARNALQHCPPAVALAPLPLLASPFGSLFQNAFT